ncbi:hypothetical protein V1511DRAFT_68522 [Dipodascopsis uninucleata]
MAENESARLSDIDQSDIADYSNSSSGRTGRSHRSRLKTAVEKLFENSSDVRSKKNSRKFLRRWTITHSDSSSPQIKIEHADDMFRFSNLESTDGYRRSTFRNKLFSPGHRSKESVSQPVSPTYRRGILKKAFSSDNNLPNEFYIHQDESSMILDSIYSNNLLNDHRSFLIEEFKPSISELVVSVNNMSLENSRIPPIVYGTVNDTGNILHDDYVHGRQQDSLSIPPSPGTGSSSSSLDLPLRVSNVPASSVQSSIVITGQSHEQVRSQHVSPTSNCSVESTSPNHENSTAKANV